MKRLLLSALYRESEFYADKDVVVAGWIRTIRDSKVFGFIELNDGSCFKSVQVVFEQGRITNFEEIAKLNVGSAIVVKGKVVLTPQMKQPFEIKADSIEIEGKSTPDYPLQKKRHSVEFLREIAHLRPRTNLFNAVMRVRSVAAFAVHRFFNERGFVTCTRPLSPQATARVREKCSESRRLTLTIRPKPPTAGLIQARTFSESRQA